MTRPKQHKQPEQHNPAEVRAAIYLRVSTTDQQSEGYGLEAQRTRCMAMTQVKGWQVKDQYVDAISGTKDASKRPELARLLADAESGNIEAVIVASLDRLGRQSRIILDLVERLTSNGVELVSCKESLDTSTPTGRFVLNMFAALAQLDRDNIVQRTTDGRNERGRIDGEKGGKIPYGYTRIPGDGVELNEEAAHVVRNIFTMRRAGESLPRIADALNTTNTLTPQGGIRWYASTVKQILDNEAMYKGGKRGESNVLWPMLLHEAT